MNETDFDIDSLAVYLHLNPSQVARMADRGKIPGRKIGGHWRFSQAEIHHWLEERIGASDEQELVEVEEVLQGQPDELPALPPLADLLPLDAISVPLLARTRTKVISAMCELAAGTGLLWDADKMAEQVQAREELHPTALDIGVALLHPRRPQSSILAQGLLAMGRTHQGIPFGGTRLTDVFFLVCSTNDREHLQMLARLSRLLGVAGFLDELRAAGTAPDVQHLVRQYEGQL